MLIVAGVTGVVMTLALILMVSSATELIRYSLQPVLNTNIVFSLFLSSIPDCDYYFHSYSKLY